MPTTPASQMRVLPILITLASLMASCRCTPATPQPVTLRIKNTGRDTLYVNDTRGQAGLVVQREVAGTWFGFDDQPCACTTCDLSCDATCGCDAGVPMVRRLLPDETFERTWSGVVQVSAVGRCGDCLLPENAPYDEPFTLELCYVTQLSASVVADAGRFASEFPAPELRTCTTKTFTPAQRTVEIGPQRGAACTTTADCQGKDELCFDGSCTAGCPSNDVPLLSGLSVPRLNNQGFFTEESRDAGVIRYGGQGRVSTVLFQGPTMTVSLERRGTAGELLRGQVQVSLPMQLGAPLEADAGVTVRFLEDSRQPGNNAFVLRDSTSSALLLAADGALSRRLLGTSELAPFSIEDAPDPFGCRQEMCGKVLFYGTKIINGAASLELSPGKAAPINTSAGTYRVLAAWNGVYREPNTCTVKQVRPLALWRER